MKPRLDFAAVAPDALRAMLALNKYVEEWGLERSLMNLVVTRASQINGCAYCLEMHTRDARAAGESEERLYMLSAWRDSPLFSARERAALAWTEALTLVADTHAPDADYEAARRHFVEPELVNLTMLIGVINVWNRLNVGFRNVFPVDVDHGKQAVAA